MINFKITSSIISTTIIVFFLSGYRNDSNRPFPFSKEFSYYSVIKCKSDDGRKHLKFNKTVKACFHLSTSPLKIGDIDYFNMNFGRASNNNEYLFKKGENIFYAIVDSDKIKYCSPLFLLSFARDDYNIFINCPGTFNNYYIQYERKEFRKEDTVFVYDLFNKNDKLKNDEQGDIYMDVIMDSGTPPIINKIWVSSQYGIIQFQTKEKGYFVTYRLDR